MKVFVRTGDLAIGDKPRVLAFYPDSTEVKDDAHGDGVTVLTLPSNAVVRQGRGRRGGGMFVLADDWRDRAGSLPVEMEAKRRSDEVFPLAEQISSLRETVQNIFTHGSDPTQWPDDLKTRKAELDEKWRYLGEVKDRARASASAPLIDLRSDKIWPRRPPAK